MESLSKHLYALVATSMFLTVVSPGVAQAEEYAWKPIRLGAGGFVTGIETSEDGTKFVRTDVYGAYRFENATQTWEQELLTSNADGSYLVGVQESSQGIYEIAVYDSNRMYMVTPRDQFLTTSDGGQTWTQPGGWPTTWSSKTFRANGSNSNRLEGQKMAVDPHDSNVVIVGSRFDGAWYTDSGGASFTRISDLGVGREITGICFDSTSVKGGKTQVVYAGCKGGGVYRSTDGGQSFALLPGSPTDGPQHARCRYGSYYFSNNANKGEIWKFDGTSFLNINPSGTSGQRVIAADPFRAGRLVAMGRDGTTSFSLDDGENWTKLVNAKLVNRKAANIHWMGDTNEVFMSAGDLVFDRVVPNRLWFAQGIGVWRWDLGTKGIPGSYPGWVEDSVGIEELVARAIATHQSDGTVYLGVLDRGVYYRTKAEFDLFPTVHGTTGDPSLQNAYWVGHAATDPRFVFSLNTKQGNKNFSAYSTDHGDSWTPFPCPPNFKPGGTMAASTPDNLVWVYSNGGGAYYTLDRGATWNEIAIRGAANRDWHKAEYLSRQIVVADPVVPKVFYIFKQDIGMFRSDDGGVTWAKLTDGNFNGAGIDRYNGKLKAVPDRAGHLFWIPGSVTGNTPNPAKAFAYRTSDRGETWQQVPAIREPLGIAFGAKQSGGYPSIFIAGWVNGDYGIWRSIDNAGSWSQIGTYPLGIFDTISVLEVLKDGSETLIIGFDGSGFAYGTPQSARDLRPSRRSRTRVR